MPMKTVVTHQAVKTLGIKPRVSGLAAFASRMRVEWSDPRILG
jgi:hypothetical protein